MKKRTAFILLGVIATATVWAAGSVSPADYPSIWHCDQQKFNWYCDEAPKPQPQAQAQPPEEKPIDVTKLKTAKEMREALDTLKDLATMNPSEENVKNYIAAQQFAFDKGSRFADTWRRVVWTNPDLDYSLRRPVNNMAIRTYDTQRDQDEVGQLKALAKEHGLMFFFRSDCPYCHQLAPTLKMLSRQYGIEILPISLDGGGLPEFPNPKPNTGQARALGIQRVPAVFIASRKTGDMAPVGYGVMSVAEIISRIFVLTNTKPGDNF